VYPKLYLNGGSMYDSNWWQVLVRIWEVTVYNRIIDLDTAGPVLVPLALVAWVGWKVYWRWLHPRWARKSKQQKLGGNNDIRDLDV
jgi:hypothetical protein